MKITTISWTPRTRESRFRTSWCHVWRRTTCWS